MSFSSASLTLSSRVTGHWIAAYLVRAASRAWRRDTAWLSEHLNQLVGVLERAVCRPRSNSDGFSSAYTSSGSRGAGFRGGTFDRLTVLRVDQLALGLLRPCARPRRAGSRRRSTSDFSASLRFWSSLSRAASFAWRSRSSRRRCAFRVATWRLRDCWRPTRLAVVVRAVLIAIVVGRRIFASGDEWKGASVTGLPDLDSVQFDQSERHLFVRLQHLAVGL
jgi:hypothetical protein